MSPFFCIYECFIETLLSSWTSLWNLPVQNNKFFFILNINRFMVIAIIINFYIHWVLHIREFCFHDKRIQFHTSSIRLKTEYVIYVLWLVCLLPITFFQKILKNDILFWSRHCKKYMWMETYNQPVHFFNCNFGI